MLVAIGATFAFGGIIGFIMLGGFLVFLVGWFIWALIQVIWYHVWCVPRYIRWQAKRLQAMSEEERERELWRMKAEMRAKVIRKLDRMERHKALAK